MGQPDRYRLRAPASGREAIVALNGDENEDDLLHVGANGPGSASGGTRWRRRLNPTAATDYCARAPVPVVTTLMPADPSEVACTRSKSTRDFW